MNNIYVDEFPKSCEECSLHRSGCLKIKKGARYIDAETCVLGNFYKFQEIDNEIDTCPLKPLSDRLAEERKKVVSDIRNKIEQAKLVYEWKGDEVHIEEILDQIERGTDD